MTDLEVLCALGGHNLTDEQKDVVMHMNDSMLVMANPGTGKTTTLRYGLVAATRMFGIDPKRILCMSFTNDATIEISQKYSDLCKALRINTGVTFSTFHSFCYSILRRTNPELRVVDKMDNFEMVQNILEMKNINIPIGNVKTLLACINYTTTRCITDEATLNSLSIFKKVQDLGITYKQYMDILDSIFQTKMFKGRIEQGDIPMFAINGFNNNPEMQKEFQDKYDLVVVDEFQDLNFIYLILLSNIAKKLVAVGDIKQQIYRFNGSDDNIVSLYKKAYPNAYITELKQSFRCCNHVADFANKIIKFNKYEGFNGFNGTGKEGSVTVIQYGDFLQKFNDITSNIRNSEDWYNYMFIYRYQFTGFILLDRMFRQNIPISIKDYIPIYNTALFNDINIVYKCTITDDLDTWRNLYSRTIFGAKGDAKIIKAAEEQKTSILNAKCLISDSERKFLFQIIKLRSIFQTKNIEEYISLFEQFFSMFWKDKFFLDRFQYEPEVYFRIITQIYRGRKWSEMIDEEDKKIAWVNQCRNLNYGIRFKTLHGAKGLEAENVFILDYDAASMPNANKFSKLLDNGNITEITDLVRDERCLLFVGITRAKNTLYCVYNAEPTLFNDATVGINRFEEWDNTREVNVRDSIIVNNCEIKIRSN